MKYYFLSVLIFFNTAQYTQAQSLVFSNPQTPQIFGNGFISDGYSNRDITISPDNRELYFTLQHKGGSYSVILHSTKHNNKWSAPEVASFSGKYNDLEASYSPDGKRIYFVSNRPLDNSEKSKDYDIWYVEKKGIKWSEPINMGEKINTKKDEFYPSVSLNGNLYFTRENGTTKEDIMLAQPSKNGYDTASALPAEVNSPGYDFNALIDPDEQYIIFTSYKREDDTGGGDLYISIKENGKWMPAKNLGKEINSTSLDYYPYVSHDKKYFFFTSSRTTLHFPLPEKKNAKQIKQMLFSVGNGLDDIYYMDFSALKRLLGIQ